MKYVKYVKISQDCLKTQHIINDEIQKIAYSSNVTFLTDLCKASDPYKYMLVYEKKLGLGTVNPTIGVKVVKGSENMQETEDRINSVFEYLRNRSDLNFISISHPSEFMYIILFEYVSGSFPVAKIIPVIGDAFNASISITDFLQELDEDESFGLEPYDSFNINKDNMLMLFG